MMQMIENLSGVQILDLMGVVMGMTTLSTRNR
jgi:hypothetical protein